MTKQLSNPGPDERKFAEHLFDAALSYDGVASTPAHDRPIGFATLYSYATDPEFEADQALADALGRDKRLQADLSALLKRCALVTIPKAAAAADERAIEERYIEGWRIRIRRVQANPDQVWIIVDYDEKAVDLPHTLFAGGIRQPLPESQDGRFQFRLDADSELVKGLRDTGTEVYLI